jgi:hypothetical protein
MDNFQESASIFERLFKSITNELIPKFGLLRY